METILFIDEYFEIKEELHQERRKTFGAIMLILVLCTRFLFSESDAIYHFPDSSFVLSCKILQLFFIGVICIAFRGCFSGNNHMWNRVVLFGISFILLSIFTVIQLARLP